MNGSVSEKNLIIENEYIRKNIILNRNRISYSETENKISKKILTAGKGSQEFVLSLKSGFSIIETSYIMGVKYVQSEIITP